MQKKGSSVGRKTLHFAIQITKALAHAHGKGMCTSVTSSRRT
jgi:hypothetical protein